MVQLLLDHNAEVSILDRQSKRTALMAAIRRSVHQDYTDSWINQDTMKVDEHQRLIVHLLLERMSIVDTHLIDHQDYEGETALHFAAK